LIIKYDILLSSVLQFCFNFAFNFNLWRYTKVRNAVAAAAPLLRGTTLTRLVATGAAVPLRSLVSADRLAPPLLAWQRKSNRCKPD
jgi:hypothetical protein